MREYKEGDTVIYRHEECTVIECIITHYPEDLYIIRLPDGKEKKVSEYELTPDVSKHDLRVRLICAQDSLTNIKNYINNVDLDSVGDMFRTLSKIADELGEEL